jgi:hypothetical protein
MKTLIAITVAGLGLIAVTATSYGQGEIVFANNTSATPVTFGSGPNAGSRVFGPGGTYEYGLYIGNAGDTSFSQLTLIDTVNSANSTQPPATGSGFAGLISGGTIVGTGNVAGNGFAALVGGTTYVVEVAAWTKADGANYAAAIAADPSDFAGLSGLGSVTAESGQNTPPQLFGTGAGQLGGFEMVGVTPEPTTLALGGLGAAALLMFRRRK